MPEATTMTGRERVKRMFNREDQDRVPRFETFWPDTIERWQAEGLVGDENTVRDRLGSDFHGICWAWPAPFPGQNTVIEEDDTTRLVLNAWGQKERQWKHRSDTIKPLLLKHVPCIDIEDTVRRYRAAADNGRWTYYAGVESFEQIRRLLGDQTGLIAMAMDPEWIVDVSRTHTDVMLATLDAAWDAGARPDGLWIYGDMAFNHATMCSPTMYRELIWPDHQRLADWAHDHGMKFIYHTDGDVNGVIDLYIQAGFDCLQPLEAKANMNVVGLCPRYGEKLAFFGNVDVMKMATNNLDLIEDEIKTKLAAGKAAKGYIYHSDHSIPPQVSWQTYQKIIAMIQRYGDYQ